MTRILIFKRLERYIHLNPLRVKLVKNMSEVERYRWCGHSVENFGIPLAEVARQVGVSTSAISKALSRTMKINSTQSTTSPSFIFMIVTRQAQAV